MPKRMQRPFTEGFCLKSYLSLRYILTDILRREDSEISLIRFGFQFSHPIEGGHVLPYVQLDDVEHV